MRARNGKSCMHAPKLHDDDEMSTGSGTHLHFLLFFIPTEAHARADLPHRAEDGT